MNNNMNLSPGVKNLDKVLRGKNLIEQSPLPTFVIDSQGICIMVNEAFLKAYNITDRELILGKSALTEPSNVKHGVVDYMKEALSGKVVETPEVDFTTPYGDRRVTRSRLFPVFGEDGIRYVVVMHEDITEQKMAEERWIEAEKESAAARERASIIEGISDVIFVLDEDMNLIDMNETAVKRTGYSPEEMMGIPVLEFISGNDGNRMNSRIVGENGSISGSIEGKLVTRDGKVISHLWSIFPFENKNGRKHSRRIICVGRDITDLKRISEREEFLNSLLRHDVSNKSQVTQSCLELLKDTDLSEEQRELLEGALNSSREEIEIIKKVRTLREVREEEGGEVSINPIIRDVMDENKYEASSKGIEIVFECFDPECDRTVIGGQLLKELFTNLVGNSIKHSGGSKIRINVGGSDRDGMIICTVEDDGRGISSEDKEMIFKRGYKKGEDAGSGLGMYLVNEIAKSYSGKVEAKDSELGGLRIDVYLKKGG
ncbi:MAG: PAS domain S-box protein [Halobacteriota archaeon]